VNILVRARTTQGYSGGRFYAWILAEALADIGHNVTFWGDVEPIFVRDFEDYPRHRSIRFHNGKQPTHCRFEFVVVVPHMGRPHAFYPEALAVAARDKARLALINFETPNWFNKYSPEPRNPRLWDGWRRIAGAADVILSISAEGTRYAREFYTEARPDCVFCHIAPAINSRVADRVPRLPSAQVTCITRLSRDSVHKGANDLRAVLGPHFHGHTLFLLVGGLDEDSNLIKELAAECAKYGATLKIGRQVTDLEKFTEISRSRALIFLSSFEGFGYPPVEALYCNVPCIAYDLPVLHEVGGAGITFVPTGDTASLREAVARTLLCDASHKNLRDVVKGAITFEAFARNIAATLSPILAAGPRAYRLNDSLQWQICARTARLLDQLTISSLRAALGRPA
jgi:glycosyltransferase involved in cell wall biosynthesis